MRFQPILDQIVGSSPALPIGFVLHLSGVTNLASRLSDEAAPGQILLSPRVYAALEERVAAQPVAELQVKGFARSVPAYELLRIVDT
jgi:hypothetical protein